MAVVFSAAFSHADTGNLTDPDNALYPALSTPGWSNSQGWDQEACWGTIQTGDLDGDGIDELVGCGADGLEIWAYDTATGVWSMQELLQELASDESGGLYSQASYYNSLVLADIDGDGAKEILGRDVNSPNLMFTYDYNSQAASQSAKWGTGPDWTLESGWDWDQPWCHETIMSAKLTSGDAHEAIVVYTTDGLQAAFYDADAPNGQNWTFSEKDSETALENVMDGAAEPSADFYQSLQAVQMDLTGVGDSDIDEIIYVAPYGSDAYVGMRRYLDGKWGYGRMDQGPWRGNVVFWDLKLATQNRDFGKSLLRFEYGDTLRVADINGDGLKEVLFLSSEGLVAYTFDQKTKCNDGTWWGWKQDYEVYGTWADFKSWAPLYQNSLRFVDIDNDGKEEVFCLTSTGGYFWSLDKGGIATAKAVGRNFSPDTGWAADDEYHYADAILFPTLSTDGSKFMLARGASGMRTYEYTSAADATHNLPHVIDAAKGNFVTFTGQALAAYNAILEYFWEQYPSLKGKDLRDTYTLSFDNRQWGVVGFTSLDGMAKPAGVSQSVWSSVKQQIELELKAVPQIYQLYSSYQDYLNTLSTLSAKALTAAYTLVDYSGKHSDKSNFWVGLITETCVNLGVDLIGAIPGLEELWLLKTALPVGKDLFSAGFSALFNGQDASGTDSSVELAYSELETKLGEWYSDNLTQLNTQLNDVLTSWGKFQNVNEFNQGILQAEANSSWSWSQSLGDLAVKQADAYKTGVYQFLLPLEYEIWWYHDKEHPWWLLTFWSDPPSYSYYYDSSLNQHWALVYKHKKDFLGRGKHAPEKLLSEVLHGNLSDSDQEKQDLFLSRNGWDIDVYRMPE